MVVVRRARPDDIPKLRTLILIADGTYYVASLLDPKTGAAKIRAFFASRLGAARYRDADTRCLRSGCSGGRIYTLRDGATLTGVPFYEARGYRALDRISVPLPDGESMTIVRVEKGNLGPVI